MKDTTTAKIEDGHFIISSDLLGELRVRFGESTETISSNRSLPWHNTGSSAIKNAIDKIKEAQPSLYIYLPYNADAITINGIAYHNFSLEVKKFSHRDELSVYVSGQRVRGLWKGGITDAARKVIQKHINDLFYDMFDSLAADCRKLAINTYAEQTSSALTEAANNIEITQKFLKTIHIDMRFTQ